MKFLLALWRRWRLRHDLYENEPDRHPALKPLQVGELFPWKGTTWRVADVRERPMPAVILVPHGETRASAITHLREVRRAHRILSKDEADARRRLARRAQ